MSRIAHTLSSRGNRKLLVPFLTVGYPTIDQSRRLAEIAIASGADMLELGMPFSDPLADGPDIQLSSHVALQNGVTLRHSLEVASHVRTGSNIPIVLMGYFNPLLAYGLERFVLDAARHGVDGFIIPDLPVDESAELRSLLATSCLASIFLVSPTSTPARMRMIDKHSTDFVYAVTVTGVTGRAAQFDDSTDEYLARLKRQLTKPFVAGFGVSDAVGARRLCQSADGVVVGSAIVRQIDPKDATGKGNLTRVGAFLTDLRRAIDHPAGSED